MAFPPSPAVEQANLTDLVSWYDSHSAPASLIGNMWAKV